MSFTYSFAKDPLKLGDKDPKYGTTWWGEVAEQLTPVKFNTMDDHQFTVGDKITCEEKVMRRTNPDPESGKQPREYEQLKKVKLLGVGNGTQERPTQQAATTGDTMLLELVKDLHVKVDKLLGVDEGIAQETVNAAANLKADGERSLSAMYKQQQDEKYGLPPDNLDELEPM